MLLRDSQKLIMDLMLLLKLKEAPKERKRLHQKQRENLERNQHQSILEMLPRESERF